MAPVKGPSVLHLFVHRLLHVVMMMMMVMLVLHFLGVRGGQCGQDESNLLHVSLPQVKRFQSSAEANQNIIGRARAAL
jgi:hypothetical protein